MVLVLLSGLNIENDLAAKEYESANVLEQKESPDTDLPTSYYSLPACMNAPVMVSEGPRRIYRSLTYIETKTRPNACRQKSRHTRKKRERAPKRSPVYMVIYTYKNK